MQLHQLKRREFITLIGGGGVAARGARSRRVPTIGLLGAVAATAWSPFVANFVRRLDELGWVEGRTVAMEYSWADARKERFAEKGEKQWQSTSCLRASLAKESARSVIHQNGQTPSKKWRRSAERP
jgi:hypothetical protein